MVAWRVVRCAARRGTCATVTPMTPRHSTHHTHARMGSVSRAHGRWRARHRVGPACTGVLCVTGARARFCNDCFARAGAGAHCMTPLPAPAPHTPPACPAPTPTPFTSTVPTLVTRRLGPPSPASWSVSWGTPSQPRTSSLPQVRAWLGRCVAWWTSLWRVRALPMRVHFMRACRSDRLVGSNCVGRVDECVAPCHQWLGASWTVWWVES